MFIFYIVFSLSFCLLQTFVICGNYLIEKKRLGLSHLNECKFNHNFDDCVNPFCTCSLEPDSTSHFFLHCYHYNAIQSILFEDLNSVDKNLFKLSDNELTLILLYGSTKYSLMNCSIIQKLFNKVH